MMVPRFTQLFLTFASAALFQVPKAPKRPPHLDGVSVRLDVRV